MNKTEFIARVAEEAEITKVAAKEQVNNVLDTILKVLGEGEDVNLSGFGKFTVKNVEASVKRNPRTGESVNVDAHRSVKFSFAVSVKNELR